MKIKSAIGLVIVSLSFLNCNSERQKDGIKQLSLKYCVTLEQVDLTESKDEILSKMMSGAIDVGENNKELILAVRQEIAKRIKSTDKKNLALTFASDFVLKLLETCPAYSKLVRKQLPEANKKNKTITYMSERIKSFITDWDGLGFLEVYNRATDSIVSNYNYAPHARDDYGIIDWDYFEPYNDIHVELLHTSDAYFKGYLINEQLRAMGADVKNFPKEVPMKFNFSGFDNEIPMSSDHY